MNPFAVYLTGLRHDWQALRRVMGQRDFVPGPAIVEPSDIMFGHDDSAFSPPEYLEYVASSNNVYTCVTKRATAMSSLPLALYKGTNKDTRKLVERGPLRDLVDSVNPWMTFDRLIYLTEQYLSLSGEAFWFLERGRSGRQPPREIWPVRPDMVKIVPDPKTFIRGFLLESQRGATPISYTPDEVIWFCYPNPLDPYAGLAPLAAARLAADTASAAMHSNFNIFRNGVRLGGVISPESGSPNLGKEQAAEINELFRKSFKGVDRSHLMAVLAYAVKFQSWSMTPKDAEFLGALDLTLEEIARAFGIAPDLLGGSKRTYQNAPEARFAFWSDTIMSEARFIQSTITERLLPMFPGEADAAEFDFSDIDALRENEDAKWTREREQIAAGAITINEWRADQGFDAVSWGDVAWLPINLVPVDGATVPIETTATVIEPPAEEVEAVEEVARILGIPARVDRPQQRRAIEYGSAEHERIMRQFDRRAQPWETKIAAVTTDLMRRQRRAVLDRLKAERSVRVAEKAAEEPFDRPRWIKQFRETIRPVFFAIVDDVGQATLEDMSLGISFDIQDPNVLNAVERQTQRFAREVNDTTWSMLKETLADGIEAGEGIDQLADRVEATMGQRIRSSGETIARTESTAVANLGAIESARQSGVVAQKEWLASLDERVRESHAAAHGQRVGLDDTFHVGGATGPGPGMMSSAAESANCRCAVVFITDVEAAPGRAVTANGHRPAEVAGVRD